MYESAKLLSVERNAQSCRASSEGSNTRKFNVSKLQSKTAGTIKSLWENLLAEMVSFMFGSGLQRSRKETGNRQKSLSEILSKVSTGKDETLSNMWLHAKRCLSNGLGSHRWNTFQRFSRKFAAFMCELSQIENAGEWRQHNSGFSQFHQLVGSQGQIK
jgi:hypothetical protein